MLREAFEEIVERGNKLRQEITNDVLNSKVVSNLASSPRLVNTVSQVIRSTSDVNKVLEKSVSEVLGFFKIPSRQQVKAYEKRIAKLEKQVNAATRKVMSDAAKPKSSKPKKSPAKAAAPKKVATKVQPKPEPTPEPQPVARNPLVREIPVTPVAERVIPTPTPEPEPAVVSPSPVSPAAETHSVEADVNPSPVFERYDPDKM